MSTDLEYDPEIGSMDEEMEEDVNFGVCPFYHSSEKKCDNNGNRGRSCPREFMQFRYTKCPLYIERICKTNTKLIQGG